jgi:DNA invertase Pin-like site-specific DNA recombinase
MPRVALYLRVSSDAQKVDMQRDGLRSLAAQRGWSLVGEYVDQGWSGSKTARPQLTAMMREITKGRVDVVAVWKLDRLGRSTRDLLNMVEELRVRNVQLVSAQESLDTGTPTGRAFLTMVAIFAELEREWLRERTIHGLQAAKRRGKRLGRPPVDVDLDVARRLLAEGQSLRAIARALGVGKTSVHRALHAAAEHVR